MSVISMSSTAYSVLTLTSKQPSVHTVTLFIHDDKDTSKDELYINDHHIHPSNWRYNSRRKKPTRSVLRYRQNAGGQKDGYLSGTLCFDSDHRKGRGIMKFNKGKGQVFDLEEIKDCVSAIVGSYSLYTNGKLVGALTIHPNELFINDKKAKSFHILGNKLSWKGAGASHCVTHSGFAVFSNDRNRIVNSSLGASGIRQFSKYEPYEESNLDLEELYNMDQYDEEGNDKVQQLSMEDVYLLIQYFMPEDWRESFISSDPIVLDDYLQEIADDDNGSGENSDYYVPLSVPYLSYALSGVDEEEHPDVKKLNYIRADKQLKFLMKESDVTVFNRHSGKLYSHHWAILFPEIQKYLDDQKNTDYTDEITKSNDQWIQDVTENLENALEPEDIAAVTESLTECGNQAITNKCYWAYAMFRDLSSTEYLAMLIFIVESSPALIDDILSDHERYCSTMSVLDPSSFFSHEFGMVLDLLELDQLIPKNIDIGEASDDLSFFAEQVCDKFVEMYTNNPDAQIAEAAELLYDNIVKYGWDSVAPLFEAAAKLSFDWMSFHGNLTESFIGKFGSVGVKISTIVCLISYSCTIALLASGMVDWDDLTAVQQAEFIISSTKASAFFIKKGFSVFFDWGPGLWENCQKIFYKSKNAIQTASEVITSCIGKWIIKNFGSYNITQCLKTIENLGDNAITKAFTKFKKYAGKFGDYLAPRIGGLFALAGVIFSVIDLINSDTPLEIAMNTMFLLSSILEVVVIVAEVAISTGVVTIGGGMVGTLMMTTIASLASGLAIAAAVVGVILLLVQIFKPRDPPDPIHDFVYGDDVGDAGLFMEHETTIEYFAVQMDDEEESKQIGITMTTDGKNYLHANNDGSVTLSEVDYSYNTVFCVSVDKDGVSDFFTKVLRDNDKEVIVHITVNDDNSIDMQPKFEDEEQIYKQQWIAECTGNAVYTDKDQLLSATFTIYNQKKKLYLYSDGKTISTSTSKQNWTLMLEFMKPDDLGMNDVVISSYSKNRSFYSYLVQSGSTSGRVFTITPSLPSWLELDVNKGILSQKEGVPPVISPPTTYTMAVNNQFGSSTTTFTIEVTDDSPNT